MHGAGLLNYFKHLKYRHFGHKKMKNKPNEDIPNETDPYQCSSGEPDMAYGWADGLFPINVGTPVVSSLANNLIKITSWFSL